tara:strand:- start:1522 stop:1773 length:252 start_codon:yes stop_codon:yes gene_type:complete
MSSKTDMFCVPIWLSKWTFKDQKNREYVLDNYIVKGYNKGAIFTNKSIVNKAVNKLIGARSKKKLVAVNLTLISQHGYGVDDN